MLPSQASDPRSSGPSVVDFLFAREECVLRFEESMPFKQSSADYSLFTLKRENSFTALLVYVDDIVLSGNDLSVISHITKLLDDKFKIKDFGNLRYFSWI